MNHLRLLLILIAALFAVNLCRAADLFSSRLEKEGFLKALRRKDPQYDPTEHMVRGRFSSPGYHTTLKAGYVHRTRDSLQYAVALLDSGQPDRLKRAQDILRRLISLQDQNPGSRTYGIWSWFLEEPLDKMSPPDWNWADFCGAQLLQVAIDHMHRLPDDLQEKVKESIIHASYSIKRRNVGSGYTNIALMGTYVTHVAGELFDVPELTEYGKARLKRFYDHTLTHGSFSEYNSPTYTVVAINEISRMLRHVKDPGSQKLIQKLNRLAWLHLARHFHAPTRQWSGPHSRYYRTLLGKSTLAFIQRATDGKVHFVPESETVVSLDAHRLRAKCPQDLFHYFTDLPSPRLEIEAFAKNKPDRHDIIGTTYLHPNYTLGSVNIGDLWNQRRPLLAFWNTYNGVVAMRLRCLHDNHDYSSASIFTVQDKSDILGAVVFATDRGDTHISLDRIRNATIRATDLRIRLELEGAVAGLKLPSKVEVGQPIRISSGLITCDFKVAHAVFGDFPITMHTSRDGNKAWIDIVLYNGKQTQIDFNKIPEAVIVFTLSINPAGQRRLFESRFEVRIYNTELLITANLDRTPYPNIFLAVPVTPMPSGKQRAAASAKLGSTNPWKTKAK
ncbi:MAG TPA: hypothetical protein VMY06_00985 [Sedimentisphaerales bacterium]|nr:hypothetical protein [Sedimentisphaerales bacterium]